MDTVDVSANPIVFWVAVIGVVIGMVSVAVPKVRAMLVEVREAREDRERRRAEFAAELRRAKIEHTAQVEAAAAILNDQRVAALMTQLDGIAQQLDAQRVRYEAQIATLSAQLATQSQQLSDTQSALDEALAEIGELRRELAEYRDQHEGLQGIG
ncbi:hypothetical protein BH790_gp23 [Gordonia phage Gsput1]|uniref:Uncharacterized protein n=1 Tax=Gordonia phage Gsput1 TaxID=1622193 RepID=A0A0E3XAL3_9CAUD|nr:hypothetical protein BH790_gp23 [Gordonia phage Gsput1]AKC03048.1 hypothetical protein Gsput1_23 [Gordonia phage Gsput1]